MNNEKLISALRSCLALGSRCEDCPLDGDYQKCKIDTLAADALEAADAKMHEQDLRIADLVAHLNAEQAKVARLVVLDEKTALAMAAGSYAIRNTKKYETGTYMTGIRTGNRKEISFYDAGKTLYLLSEAALGGEEHD